MIGTVFVVMAMMGWAACCLVLRCRSSSLVSWLLVLRCVLRARPARCRRRFLRMSRVGTALGRGSRRCRSSWIPVRQLRRGRRVRGRWLLISRGIVSVRLLSRQSRGLFRARPFAHRLGPRSISHSSCGGCCCVYKDRTSFPCLEDIIWS